MSTSCVLHPRLSNGEKSPLFSRLKNFLGDRKSAEDVYYRAINPSFKEAFPNVRFDHNGEPLLEDLITQCGIGHSKSNEAMLDYLNSEYGTKPVPRTMQSVIELQNRAASFNINSPLNKRYSAEITSSGHDVSMEVVTATGNGRDLGKQQRFNAELNNQLIKLLNSWGADVAALTELEEAGNVNGVMDLSAGINAATGLKEVIRISKRHRWSNVSKKEDILTDEEQEILNNAPRNSQGKLLAPNGKVSNLTEKQYAQVRTKAFKDWFGDWETANKENPYSKDISIGPPEADFSNVDANGTGVLIPIFLNGEYIGETGLDNALYNKYKGMSIEGEYMEMPSVGGSNITIEKEYRGKGYGKATYFELAKLAANNGKILRSASDKSRTPASTRVWESLTRDGYAKRVDNRYEFINSTLKASKVVDENGEPTDNDIADDTYDSNILAEEWGHFVVDAVKDSPLRDRMLNSLRNEEVLQRVLGSEYDRYNEVYKGDIDLMAKEALGKMMAQVLNNYDPTAPNDRLFERYKNSILDFFSRRDIDEIDEIINKVREQVYEFTTNVFNGKYQLNISSRGYNERLFNLGNNVSRDYNILKRIIQQERKRLAIYGKGAKATAKEREGKRGSFDEKQKLFIDKLNNDLENHRELEGIYTYLTEAIRMMRQLSDKLDAVHNSQTSWKDKFSALRSIRDYMSSYGSIMEELRQEMFKAKQEGDMRFKEKLQESLNEFSGLLAGLGSDWAEVSKDEFAGFLTPFEGESISMSIRGERKQYNIRELLDYIEKDISIVERWTDAMADSTDPILRIYDSLVKDQKSKARYNTINNEKEILMHSKKLEDAGVKNTNFMYEKTSDGKITGNFVTRYNWGDYFAALSKYAKSLPKDMEREEKSILISRWKRANTDRNGNPIEKYYNPQYDAIQRNAAMKEYYDFMINLKRNLDYRLPARYVRFNKAPQIRRDFLERVMGKGNKFQYLWESFKDNLVRREDDTEFAYARQDFEGNQIYNLPIYYTRTLKDKNDLSTDCTSTMIAYAAMANDYAAMNDVIDALETGRVILSERKVAQTRGGKIMREVLNKVPSNLTKKGDVANFMGRLNDFMLMQVYGEQMKDEGTVLGVDVGKAVNMLNKLQSYGTTALSVLTGTANLAQNVVISNIEAISGQFFNKSELAKADWEYTKLLPQYLSEVGNRIQTSKMALFAEKFNVLQDYKQHVRGVDWDRKTWFSRFFKEDTLWFTTSAGDHYTQMRTGLALAMRLKLQDKDGKPISLYDALEVQYLDEAHPEYGANLVIKEGVTDQDGKVVDNKYFGSITKKIRGINNKLYGIYNQEDKSAMQSRAVGRLLMMYRNWMRPLWLKRYGVERYNYDTSTFEEGYYRTLWNFMNTLRKDLKKGELDIVKQWHNLDDAQKSNIYRGLAEIATFLSLMGIIAALKGVPDDDDKDNWLTEYVNYSIIRLKADLGSLMPGPTMLDEGLRLFDNPFAAVRVLKNSRQLLNLFDPDTWTTEIDQGIYKGYTQAEKIMLQPVPFIRQFQNLFDPEEPTRWYK